MRVSQVNHAEAGGDEVRRQWTRKESVMNTYDIFVSLLQCCNTKDKGEGENTRPWSERRDSRDESDDNDDEEVAVGRTSELFKKVLGKERPKGVFGRCDEIRRQRLPEGGLRRVQVNLRIVRILTRPLLLLPPQPQPLGDHPRHRNRCPSEMPLQTLEKL